MSPRTQLGEEAAGARRPAGPAAALNKRLAGHYHPRTAQLPKRTRTMNPHMLQDFVARSMGTTLADYTRTERTPETRARKPRGIFRRLPAARH